MNRRDILKLSGTLFAGAIFTRGLAATQTLESIAELGLPTTVDKTPLYLHYNENSLGLSKKAQQAIIDIIPSANRYPDAYIEELQQTIADSYQMKTSQVTLGVGSSDVIRAIINKLGIQALQKGQKIQFITPNPTFFLAADHAEGIGIPVVMVPLNEKYEMDLDKMKQAADNFDGLSICYLCNPNNPTGTLTSSASIEKWVKTANADKTFFMVDEAYAEYITDPSFVSGTQFVQEGMDNVIVLRTFSKIFAMAGMRVGYGLATEKLTQELVTFMSILNINITAAVAGIASLKDKQFLADSIAMNSNSLAITTSTLDALGLEYLPSQGNFVFHKITGDPQKYMERMEEAGILVGRPFPPLTQWSRVSLGTPEEMTRFTATLKDFRKKGWV
ncbi:pyridoxal phosphate-dependent aminotransferase [Myroides phaeus]|uniref:pyridoxal phosphate-dependent aminotransferase n=1 Tax=Myroides phaeus TaxID=702745 RepID=UPI00130367C6|nr:histidinol-phosphate transaminase [Myroides phaeus]